MESNDSRKPIAELYESRANESQTMLDTANAAVNLDPAPCNTCYPEFIIIEDIEDAVSDEKKVQAVYDRIIQNRLKR
jgi:hypothetical protein